MLRYGLVVFGLWLAMTANAGMAWAEETPAAGATPGEVVDSQLKALQADQLKVFLERLDSDAQQVLPELNLREMIFPGKNGKTALDPRRILAGLLKYLFKEVVANTSLLGQLLVLAVICAVLQQMQGAIGDRSFGDLTFAVSYLVLIFIGVKSFYYAAGYGRTAIDDMVALMQALLPMFTTLLVAIGGVTTAAILHPLMFAVTGLVGTLLKNVVIPLLFFSTVVGLAGNISEKFPMARLAALVRQVAVATLGIFFSIFLGTMLVRGVTAPVTDAVTIKAGKFLASNFIPIIGKMFSDAVEIVAGCSLLVKNAIGLVGIILIFAFAVFPVLKILGIIIVYKVANALMEPIGDKRLVEALGHLESSLMFLVVVVGAVGLMFFVSLTIIISVGSFTAGIY
ncbi:MAG: stage III sporulation protein AE [Firmicutes bacterium]|nr:stage III sporulation protein AE [Bacillota bacterium]